MTDPEDAFLGEVDATCLLCGRDMMGVRTDTDNPFAVLRRVECPAGHTGTVEIRTGARADTHYRGAAAGGGVDE